MELVSLILFFVYLYGFGFAATSFLKKAENLAENFWERNIMRLGIGVAVFALVGIILNFLRIPLDWKIFLFLSLIAPGYYLFKHRSNIKSHIKNIHFTKSDLFIAGAILLFIFSFYMYHKGAFAYSYLEDDDPWEHARSVKYIATEKTAFESYPGEDLFRYTDPYPPGYEIMMAVLYQTSTSLNWTLKFFNALFISLSILFFYFFAQKMTGSKKKALFATFVLAMIPSYLSHFIWVHTLLPLLIFVTFYCFESIKEDKRWGYTSALVVAGIFVVHPEHAIKFSFLFAIYFIAKWAVEKQFPKEHLYACITGGLLSLFWWGAKLGSFFQERMGRITPPDSAIISSAKISTISKLSSFFQSYFSPYSGTATRPYTFNDFFIAKAQNMINSPIGWGIVISLLLVVSIILVIIAVKKYREQKKYYPFVLLGWFVLMFMIVNSATFGTPGFLSFRTWMLLAIPVALLCAEGYSLLMGMLPENLKSSRLLILAIIVIGLWFTAGSQKFSVNTAAWPPGGGFTSPDEVNLYLWIYQNLPKETKVFPFSGNQDNHLLGLDMANCDWCLENREFRKGFLDKTPAQTYSFLKAQGYQYLLLDTMSIPWYQAVENKSQETVLNKFQEYGQAGDKFSLVFQNKGGAVLKVN